jgi:hypothetical protein
LKINSWRIDLAKASLSQILPWCSRLQQANRLLMTVMMERARGQWRSTDRAVERWIRKNLGGALIEEFLALGWPGTLRTSTPNRVFIFRFDDELMEKIISTEPHLQGWVHNHRPGLPEDLCVFRAGAKLPALYSVTHERDAWVIRDRRPSLPGVSAEFARNKRGAFLFSGEYWCVQEASVSPEMPLDSA